MEQINGKLGASVGCIRQKQNYNKTTRHYMYKNIMTRFQYLSECCSTPHHWMNRKFRQNNTETTVNASVSISIIFVYLNNLSCKYGSNDSLRQTLRVSWIAWLITRMLVSLGESRLSIVSLEHRPLSVGAGQIRAALKSAMRCSKSAKIVLAKCSQTVALKSAVGSCNLS